MTPFPARNFFDLTTYHHAPLFQDVEHVWEVFAKISPYLQSYPLKEQEGFISPGAHIVNPESVRLGEHCVVEAGAYIVGPCIIGHHTHIRHGAYIRGHVIAGNYCVIGHCTEVKNAVLLDGVHADHFAYIGDSILGNNVHLGAGVKCANLRLDNGLVSVRHEGISYATGLRKLGAIIGDNSQLGCNSVTNPGSFLGKHTYLMACTSYGGGVVPDYSTIYREGKIAVSTHKKRM